MSHPRARLLRRSLAASLVAGVAVYSGHAHPLRAADRLSREPSIAGRIHGVADEAAGAMANALSGVSLLTGGSDSPAARAASARRGSNPEEAALLSRIASQPIASWMGGWVSDIRSTVSNLSALAGSKGQAPVLVAYNIPSRDCGSHSAGGERDGASYGRWIRSFADGLSGRRAVVVLEPDALAQIDCLSPEAQTARTAMVRDAVGVLKARGATVYIDAGNARWKSAAQMADRLKGAGIERADGFALNVSNFIPTDETMRYGKSLSGLVGGKHYIIDTSRNGAGSNGEWCNPRGRALGQLPTTNTGSDLADAFLWVKQPGESDGACNGGPKAGEWWADYALELARNAPESVLAKR